MQPLIYDVAVSIDGYISGAFGDVSRFAREGPVVEDYQKRLGTYATAVMGRQTYEFGYRFGMSPGDNPYASMKTYVFSTSLQLPEGSEVPVIPTGGAAEIRRLKEESAGPIYLCGGGDLAGKLLALKLIDSLVLKRAPIILGQGTRLFGGEELAMTPIHVRHKTYDNGYVLQEFDLSG